MCNELEAFVALFGELKHKVNNSPSTLSWLSNQKSDVRRLAYLVGESADKIRKNRAGKPERHQVVPPGFISAWDEYENRFTLNVSQILEAERKAGVEDFLAELKGVAVSRGKDVDSLLKEILAKLESHKQPGDSFNPLKDDPVSLIYNLLLTYEDVVREILPDDEYADKAIGAWHFFEGVLGLDHRGIYDRWKQVPELLIPSHALRVDPQPIFELYNEAVRCYVFGNRIAAISMCRALLEHILSKHYKIEEAGLDNMITVAEGRYKHFKRMRMNDRRKLANRIMHDYEKKPHVEDEAVVEFLKTIRTLVRDIPK